METFEKNGYKVTIEQDSDPISPSEYQDTSAFIVTTRNRYFQVEGPNGETAQTISENMADWEETHHVYKLNALIHSGVHLSITSDLKQYYMGFDSGQIGFVLITKDQSEIPHPFEYAEGRIETWNQYLSGDVWGFTIEDGDENNVDSCWGFYGFDTCKSAAMDSASHQLTPEVPYDKETADLRAEWKQAVQDGDTRLGWEEYRKENE